MKMMHALALAAALPAMAQSPAEFRFDAPVAVSGADALNRVTLPFEAYRDARPDLADLRLFNAQGEALPIAFAGEPAAVREEPKSVALPIFPISAQEARAVGQGALDVTVRSKDTGWERYADRIEALASDGTILGTRELDHPHDTEQPFTRDLYDLRVPPGIVQIVVRAHFKPTGHGGAAMTVALPGR